MAETSGLSLEEVEALGGTEADLKMLRTVDVDSASELEFQASDDTCNVAEYNKVKLFLERIGLQGETANTSTRKKKRMTDTSVDSVEGKDDKSSLELEQKILKLRSKACKKMLISLDSEMSWLEQADSETTATGLSSLALDHLASVGEELLKTEVAVYEKVREKSKGSSEVRWLRTVMSSGTLSDKMASLTLLVQESPVHSLSALNGLLAMASKKGKRECIQATETLKELWLTDLLPDNRKLKAMKQRPFGALVEMDSSDYRKSRTQLLLWYFEDQLKAKFAKYLGIVKVLSHDAVENIREKMLGCVFDLLYRKPEQEKELLSQLVNKLGDPAKKVASKAAFFLLKLVNHHVNMKLIVANELELLLHRPNISLKAQYYAVCTLNQFTIASTDTALASKLAEIYFTFFKAYIAKEKLDGKMLSALLTGVNRAFPFIKDEIPSLEEHMQSLYKMVHVGPLATGIQSLMLLYQVMESRHVVSARYYQALYAKLLDPRLKHGGKQAIFLNLLFKSIKFDPELSRVKAFLKRTLQVCVGHSPPFVCGCLYIISEVLKLRPNLWGFILQSEFYDEECFPGTTKPAEREEGGSHVPIKPRSHNTTYSAVNRNPLYCRAEMSCLWELAWLQAHFHPSVQAFAKKISAGEYIEYHGDPLLDFTLMRFLDRFVLKNPKQKVNDHGGSLMQRTSKLVMAHQKEIAVTSSQFASLNESKIREDELFMHKYFVEKASMEAKAKKKKKKKNQKKKKKADEDDKSGEERSSDEIEKGLSNFDTKMDFAGELERQEKSFAMSKKKRKKKKADDESEEEEDSDVGTMEFLGEDDFGSDFDGGMDSDEDSLVGGEGKGEATEAEMEQLLLRNMSSCEEGSESDYKAEGPPKKKKRNMKAEVEFDSSMFAAAEEFAHLLEKGATTTMQDKFEDQHSRESHRPKRYNQKRKSRTVTKQQTNSNRKKKVLINHQKRKRRGGGSRHSGH